jgi:hypothetical protein
MLIGQSLFIPGLGSPGVTYNGPWMPRQGDAFTANIEIMRQSSSGWGLVLEVQTKNQEDSDSAANVIASSSSLTATGTFSVGGNKALELVRCCLVCTGGGTDRWLHLRMNPFIWQPN